VLRRLIALAVLLLLEGPVLGGQTIVVDAPSSLAGAAARIEGIDRDRLVRTLQRAGLEAPPDIDVTAIAEDDPRAAAIPGWIVALASGTRDIVVFPDRVVAYPYDSLESVVQHEIAHLALTRRAGGAPLPRWFHEGVAVSVDVGWDLSSRLQLLLAMREDPTIGDVARLFQSGRQSESTLAYRLAAALVEDVRRRHGADVPGRIASRVAAGDSFERAFELTTGESADAAATRAWAAYSRWTGWVPALTSPSMPWAAILVLAFLAFAVRLRRRTIRRRQEWGEE
jgi:hypothetical protein